MELRKGWDRLVSEEDAHRVLKVISDAQGVTLGINDFGNAEARIIGGLSHIGYLRINVGDRKSSRNLEAITTIARVEEINLWGKDIDDSMIEPLSRIGGLTLLYIGTEGRVTASGLDCLSRLPDVKELAIMFREL